MSTEEVPKSRLPLVIYMLGLLWSLAFGLYWLTLDPGSDDRFVIVAPVGCLILVFAWLRRGAIVGFLMLAFATYCFFGHSVGDMRDAPRAFAFLTIVVGGPIAFVVGLIGKIVDLSRKTEPRA